MTVVFSLVVGGNGSTPLCSPLVAITFRYVIIIIILQI